MSSAEQNSPKENKNQANGVSDSESLQAPAKRPTLVSPPKRPAGRPQVSGEVSTAKQKKDEDDVKPSASVVKPSESAHKAALDDAPSVEESSQYQPIAPPSEPMQYRAIGLVRGTYQPTEDDQLNRGSLITEDGSVIDSVLLGRVTSLVKKHIDLASSHLWVVYPRTRRNDENQEQDLHLQIVGIWEPETLGLPGEAAPETGTEQTASEAEAEADRVEGTGAKLSESPDLPSVEDNFFSIRGEVVKYSPEDELISVKILQGVKRSPGGSKSFKVNLKGTIAGRTVGYFWDFKAKRHDQLLVLEDASVVGIVPPKKRSKKKAGSPKPSRGGGSRPMPSRRPSGTRGSSRPRKIDVRKDLGA